MANDEHLALLRRGAAVWNAWRLERDELPDLSQAGLRGLNLSGCDLSRADIRGADFRGTNLSRANLSAARLEEANLFKAVLVDADLAGAFLYEAQFLNCAQLVVARNWQSAFRDDALVVRTSQVKRPQNRRCVRVRSDYEKSAPPLRPCSQPTIIQQDATRDLELRSCRQYSQN